MAAPAPRLGAPTATRRGAAPDPATPLLAVEGLTVELSIGGGAVRVLDGIDFAIGRGETLGLVGESGCGKTITSLAVMGLLATPPMRVAGGAVRLDGRDLLALSEPEMERVRGRRVAMIFQEPMTSLNPVLRVGAQIEESLRRHLGLRGRAAQARTVELLARVGIPEPARIARDYPHRLSGGMRQRVMIAMALAGQPDLLIADEPTTALDVTIQAQILDLLRGLQAELGMGMLFITHDLAVIAETAHRVAVMYAGRIVETGPVDTLFAAPRHPYTRGLLASIPQITRERAAALPEIAGTVPDPLAPRQGCAFADRCPEVMPRCREQVPPFFQAGPHTAAACWRVEHG
jgi:oligopeptide/dipeptide ABC transporter ATP-binding protein